MLDELVLQPHVTEVGNLASVQGGDLRLLEQIGMHRRVMVGDHGQRAAHGRAAGPADALHHILEANGKSQRLKEGKQYLKKTTPRST